jgi:hypothetical protein
MIFEEVDSQRSHKPLKKPQYWGSINGADLHNLLKLFESLVDGRLVGIPSIPSVSEVRDLIIY